MVESLDGVLLVNKRVFILVFVCALLCMNTRQAHSEELVAVGHSDRSVTCRAVIGSRKLRKNYSVLLNSFKFTKATRYNEGYCGNNIVESPLAETLLTFHSKSATALILYHKDFELLGSEEWRYHVVVKVDGYILDMDLLSNRREMVTVDDYFTKLFSTKFRGVDAEEVMVVEAPYLEYYRSMKRLADRKRKTAYSFEIPDDKLTAWMRNDFIDRKSVGFERRKNGWFYEGYYAEIYYFIVGRNHFSEKALPFRRSPLSFIYSGE